MCDYASIPCPEITGNSLHPIVEHPDLSGTSFLVSELHSDPNDMEMRSRMVRTERHKYVAFPTGRNPEQIAMTRAIDPKWDNQMYFRVN